jgi:DNA-binding transcriptional LysR family regulator
MCRVVRETDAIGMAIHPMLAEDLAARRFVMLPIDLPWLVTRYGIIQPARHTPSPSAVAFVDLLQEIEAGIEIAAGDAP